MAVRYLLDTNTASYIIKGNKPGVRERLVKVPMSEVAISAVTEAELRFGVARRPDAARLKIAVEEFLLRVASLGIPRRRGNMLICAPRSNELGLPWEIWI